MAVKTIGSTGDYADVVLWAAGEGNVNDGTLAEGVMLESIQNTGLCRPNQTFPNGGLLRGDITLTGEPNVGRELSSTDGTRIVLSPSDNLDFEDIIFRDDLSTSAVQSINSNTFTRCIMADSLCGIIPDKQAVFNQVVYKGCDVGTGTTGSITTNQCLTTARNIIRAGNFITFKNSISITTDWLLGRGVYAGSDSLVNYSVILENAPASDFGTGSSNNTLNTDATSEIKDLAGRDYRTKSTSPYATAGEGGTFIGAFLETGSGDTLNLPYIQNESVVHTPNIIETTVVTIPTITSTTSIHEPTLIQDQSLNLAHVQSISAVFTPSISSGLTISLAKVTSNTQVYSVGLVQDLNISLTPAQSTTEVFVPTVVQNQVVNLASVNNISSIYLPTLIQSQTLVLPFILDGDRVWQDASLVQYFGYGGSFGGSYSGVYTTHF